MFRQGSEDLKVQSLGVVRCCPFQGTCIKCAMPWLQAEGVNGCGYGP